VFFNRFNVMHFQLSSLSRYSSFCLAHLALAIVPIEYQLTHAVHTAPLFALIELHLLCIRLVLHLIPPVVVDPDNQQQEWNGDEHG
jgi:hypothetical protein